MTDDAGGARIAHVLFLDIVGYSRETVSMQSRLVQELNGAVNRAPSVETARSAGAIYLSPTGDGAALVFFHDVLAPVETAVFLDKALRASRVPVRMGVHSGLVQSHIDVTGREGFVGEGINTAQRVMDFGDAGHILLSAQYAAWLQHFPQWADFSQPLGEGIAKHDLQLTLYSLHGDNFGARSLPAKLQKAETSAVSPAAQPLAVRKRVTLLYRPNLRPDGNVLKTLEERLKTLGHEVFVDNQTKISPAWAQSVEQPIRNADAVIAIVSPQSLRSEMLEYEVETAHDQFLRAGQPVLLPVYIGDAEPLEGNVAAIIRPLHPFYWTGPQDDEKLVAELLSAITEPLEPRLQDIQLEPVGGAVPPESPFYMRRACDADLLKALDAQESILLVKGARQIGKTSLLAQGVDHSDKTGHRVAVTDFQKFNTMQMASDETFYRILTSTLARQLNFPYDFAANWDAITGANLNMENFLRDLLDASEQPLVWYMDEVDKLFAAPFASDFFGLVRSWHNARSTERRGPWRKLTVVIAYATEAHLFIQDLNQSPFNVGRKIPLDDFNLQQTIDLNVRYGSPLRGYADAEQLYAQLGGHPFLTRCALDALATQQASLTSLLETADADGSPFNDHLKRLLVSVSRLPEVTEYARGVLGGTALPHQDAYHRLFSAGIVRQDANGKVVFRCELYRRYLQRLLA